MRVTSNRAALAVFSHHRQNANALVKSMRRLSSGSQINRPGDAPTELGISETLRFQIRNGEEARRNIENANNLISVADIWMQNVHDILGRMGELAVAAIDGSKIDKDRESLDLEYQQLKDEISRISRDARYNGLQIAGRDQLLSYDPNKETFKFSQLDGSESYDLNVKVLSGLQSKNNTDFQASGGNHYLLSERGDSIFMVDNSNNLTRYDIETGLLFRDSTDTESKRMDVDEKGRLWYATETAAGSGTYSLRQQNITTWAQDTDIISSTDIVDMASPEFAVYDDHVYYLNTSNQIVKRDLFNISEFEIQLDTTTYSTNTTQGQFSISEDGRFVADVSAASTVRVMNLDTKNYDTFLVNTTTIDNLNMSVDSNMVAFTDSTNRTIVGLDMVPGEDPQFTNVRTIHNPSGASGFRGLSLDGGSNRLNFRVHNGPDANQQTFIEASDVRMYTLGLARTKISSIDEAQEALERIKPAQDKVSDQRAKLGATANRLGFGRDSLTNYMDNISQTISRLRDTDIAKESSEMARHQVQNQAGIALLSQANALPQSVLTLFNSR